nr:zinc finger, C6HC-type [Tanacetum cinerariifolium]
MFYASIHTHQHPPPISGESRRQHQHQHHSLITLISVESRRQHQHPPPIAAYTATLNQLSQSKRGHVAAKIQENIIKVRCPYPNCKRVIGPEACRLIVPREVLERWEDALCELELTPINK